MSSSIANIFVLINGKVTGPYSMEDISWMTLPSGSMLCRNGEPWLDHNIWKKTHMQGNNGKAAIPVTHDPAEMVNYNHPKTAQPLPTVHPVAAVPVQPVPAGRPVAAVPVQPIPAGRPVAAVPVQPIPAGQPVVAKPVQPIPAAQPVVAKPVQPIPAAQPAAAKPVQPVPAAAKIQPANTSSINPMPLEKVSFGSKNSRYRICPHCGTPFDLGRIYYISVHPDLTGDPILGEGALKRFLPTRFDSQGYAVDERGLSCQQMACPHCHLHIPEACCQLPGSTFSIVGAPGCGKSYFMTSMLWQLRHTLSGKFDFSLNDTDEEMNSVLNEYENLLFLNRDRETPVSLPKTAEFGENYSNRIFSNGIRIDLPRPFIFTLTPQASHPSLAPDDMRNIIFYDNAGEHFAPGRNNINNLATQHLIHSECITFLYDPLQDSRMAGQCDASDPQQGRRYHTNQMVLFNEMVARIRRYTGLQMKEKCSKTLVVVIPKYDAWKDIFPIDLQKTDFIYYSSRDMQNYFDIGTVTAVSYSMREMLGKIVPELVSACESFFESVYFIPVSALGHIPQLKNDEISISPQDIAPIWAEVPILLQLYCGELLQGVDTFETDKDALEITNYKHQNGVIICNLPECSRRESLPCNYGGFTVYVSDIGKYVRIPAFSPEEGSSGTAQGANDNSFWENLEI